MEFLLFQKDFKIHYAKHKNYQILPLSFKFI